MNQVYRVQSRDTNLLRWTQSITQIIAHNFSIAQSPHSARSEVRRSVVKRTHFVYDLYQTEATEKLNSHYQVSFFLKICLVNWPDFKREKGNGKMIFWTW